MRIIVVGTGYVGLTTGACFAYLGNDVVCYDIDQRKIDMLSKGQLPFFEPFLDDLVKEQVKAGRLKFTVELSPWIDNAEVIFICVATPSREENGAVDLSFVRNAAYNIGLAMKKGPFRVIVNKSTVPVGSNGFVRKLILEGLRAKNENEYSVDFATASNPEFLREGSAVSDALYPDRIVVGVEDERALSVMQALYEPIIRQDFNVSNYIPPRPHGLQEVPFVSTDPVSAEVIKYAANAFLAMKISFINEVANICELVGADVRQVAHGIGLDKRIGLEFLNAGIGWGGSCFGKDLRGIISDAREYGYDPILLRAVYDINYQQRQSCVRKLQEVLKVIRGRTVAIWGLSFKPGTDDLRDAPSLDVIKKLVEMGALVRAYDPVAIPAFKATYPDLPVKCIDDKYEVAEGADGLILVTEWPEFREVDWELLKSKMRQPVIIDGRNFLERKEMEEMGYVYRGIGVPSKEYASITGNGCCRFFG